MCINRIHFLRLPYKLLIVNSADLVLLEECEPEDRKHTQRLEIYEEKSTTNSAMLYRQQARKLVLKAALLCSFRPRYDATRLSTRSTQFYRSAVKIRIKTR